MEKYQASWPKYVTKPLQDLAPLDLPKALMTGLCLLEENVCRPLAAKHNDVHFSFNMHRLTGLGYYDGPCFHIKMTNVNGETFMLVDGGSVNWTKQLLCDSKERLMTSGIGIELLCCMFHSQDIGVKKLFEERANE